jgi:hypothetical protein
MPGVVIPTPEAGNVTIYGYDGSVLRKVNVDATGKLNVNVVNFPSTQNVNVINFLESVGQVVRTRVTASYSATGGQTMNVYTVPTGKRLTLTAFVAFKVGGTLTYLQTRVYDGTSFSSFDVISSPADYVSCKLYSSQVIPAGWVLQVFCYVSATTPTVVGEIVGYLI